MRDENVVVVLHEGVSKDVADIVNRYWARSDSGDFVEGVSELAKEIGRSPEGLVNIVRDNSYSYLEVSRCPSCGAAYYVDCRKELRSRLNTWIGACDECGFAPNTYANANANANDSGDEAPQQLPALTEREPETVRPIAPTKIHANYLIDLDAFTSDPRSALAACHGDTLLVMDNGAPLFYCTAPE